MRTNHELILADLAHRTDHEVEHRITVEPAEVIGLHPRLILARHQTYIVRLEFWLHLMLPDGETAGVQPFLMLDGRRRLGSWVASDTTDHGPGFGCVRDTQVWLLHTSTDARLTVGLLIRGGGRYSVGYLSAIAYDPALADHIVYGRVGIASAPAPTLTTP